MAREIKNDLTLLVGCIAVAGFTQMHGRDLNRLNPARPDRITPPPPVVQPYIRPVPFTPTQETIIASINRPTESQMIPVADQRDDLVRYIEKMTDHARTNGDKHLRTIIENDFSFNVDLGPTRHGYLRYSDDGTPQNVHTYSMPLSDNYLLRHLTEQPLTSGDRISWAFEVLVSFSINGERFEKTFAAQRNPQGEGFRFIDRNNITQDSIPPGVY